MATYTDGVQFAWQVAAYEAGQAHHAYIEPEHLFIGLCRLADMPIGTYGAGNTDLPPDSSDVLAEMQVLRRMFHRFDMHPTSLRRGLREWTGTGRAGDALKFDADKPVVIHRSQASRAVFSRAETAAKAVGLPVDVLHVLAGILEVSHATVVAFLEQHAIDVVGLTQAARDHVVLEWTSVQTMPADQDPADLILPAAAAAEGAEDGYRSACDLLRRLYDFATALGAADNADLLSQCVIDQIRAAVPAADRAGLLLIEHGMFKAKAFYPHDHALYSRTLAQDAIKLHEAKISSLDATGPMSAIESVMRHGTRSAMYAPLLWRDVPLGVVYVESIKSANVFDDADLWLLMAMAGLTAIALHNMDLQRQLGREEENLARILRRFPPQVRIQYIDTHGRPSLGGKRVDPVTVLFSDVRGFTALSYHQHPGDVMRLLNDMFHECIPIIESYDGTVDKYVGDAIMAVFGSHETDERQCFKAVRAAHEMQQVMLRLEQRWQQYNLPAMKIGIGIHCGEAVHGFVGTNDCIEYTVIGDTVNRASRYADSAGPGEILISPRIYEDVHSVVKTRPGVRVLKTKHSDTEKDLEAYVVIDVAPDTKWVGVDPHASS